MYIYSISFYKFLYTYIIRILAWHLTKKSEFFFSMKVYSSYRVMQLYIK